MAELSQYVFSHAEVTEALVKKLDLHEGLWQVTIEFKLAAALMGSSAEDAMPTALVGVSKIGMHKVEKKTHLTVDAAVVNPKKSEQ